MGLYADVFYGSYDRASRDTQAALRLREMRAQELYRQQQLELQKEQILNSSTRASDSLYYRAQKDSADRASRERIAGMRQYRPTAASLKQEAAVSADEATNYEMNKLNPPAAEPVGTVAGAGWFADDSPEQVSRLKALREGYFKQHPTELPGDAAPFTTGVSGLKYLQAKVAPVEARMNAARTALVGHVASSFPGISYDDIAGKPYQFPPIPMQADGKNPIHSEDIPGKTIYLQPPNKAPVRGTQEAWDKTLGLAAKFEEVQNQRKQFPRNIPQTIPKGTPRPPAATATPPATAAANPQMEAQAAIAKIQASTLPDVEKQRRITAIQAKLQGM